MGTYVVLFRSVNVGGRNRVAMPDLRDVVASLGFGDVVTYVQSGNVVCTGRGKPSSVAETIARGVEENLGLAVPVLVRSGRRWAGVLGGNPLASLDDDPKKLHVTFLDRVADPERVARLAGEVERFAPDRLQVVGADVFLHCPGGYGQTALTNAFLERKLGVTATTRNWRTVLALAGLAGVANVEIPVTDR